MSSRKSKLAQTYDLVKSRRAAGFDITPEYLRETFKLTNCGVSCLLFMLAEDEFYPELEKVSLLDDFSDLIGKDESKDHMLMFLEDMPPFKKLHHYMDIPARDKSIYLSMGIARRFSFEEFRQFMIKMYVISSRVLKQHGLDILEAVSQGNRDYLLKEFADKTDAKITKYLKSCGLKRQQIGSVLKLISNK